MKKIQSQFFSVKNKIRALWSEPISQKFFRPKVFQEYKNGHFKNVQNDFPKKLLDPKNFII
jgi:hypothetical protein